MFLVSSMGGGGAERVASLLSNHWVRSGHRVTLVPTFAGRGDCAYALDASVRLEYLADHVRRSRVPLPGKVCRLLALRGLMRSVAPDVVVSFLTHVNVAALIAAVGLSVPVVVSERTYPPAMNPGFGLSQLRRLTYPRASSVVMQTETGLEWLKKACPGASGTVVGNPVVLPLPVSTPVLGPATVVHESRRIVLAVGRLGEEKGYAGLIRSFALLAERYRDWDLVILGEGDERPALERARDGLGLGQRVWLPGRVGNLGDWYHRADVYALSSRFEGFPNALLEAMSHGVPAISFDCRTGPSSIIRDQLDGILVPPASGIQGFAAALESLLGDAARRTRMARAALEVRERFSLSRIAGSWDRVLGLDGIGRA